MLPPYQEVPGIGAVPGSTLAGCLLTGCVLAGSADVCAGKSCGIPIESSKKPTSVKEWRNITYHYFLRRHVVSFQPDFCAPEAWR